MKIEWTTEPPTEPGFYWMRKGSHEIVTIIDVEYCQSVSGWSINEINMECDYEWDSLLATYGGNLKRSADPMEIPE